jgi:transposase
MLDWTCRRRQRRSALSTSKASGCGEASARPIPERLRLAFSKHAGVDAKVGIETGSMTPWLVHGLRGTGLDVRCLDAGQVKVALQMRLNKTDENDAGGLAQIMRTGWYRAVHVKSLDAHRARALPGARARPVGMTTHLSNMIRGILKTFGLLPGTGRGLGFDRKVEALLEGAPARHLAATAGPIAVFDKAVRQRVRADPICRLLMTVPGILSMAAELVGVGRLAMRPGLARHSEIGSTPRTRSMQARRRAGLSSFPGRLLKGSACLASGPTCTAKPGVLRLQVLERFTWSLFGPPNAWRQR